MAIVTSKASGFPAKFGIQHQQALSCMMELRQPLLSWVQYLRSLLPQIWHRECIQVESKDWRRNCVQKVATMLK